MPLPRPSLPASPLPGPIVTPADRQLMPVYFRLIDAADAGANWRDAARVLLGLDPEADDARAIYDRHLARARWMVGEGWKQLLAKAIANPRHG